MRRTLARNEAISSDVLAPLSEDYESYVRFAVVANPSAPVGLASFTATALLRSSEDELLLDVIREADRREELEVDPEVLGDALDKLAKSRVRLPDLRRIAARDQRTRPDTMTRLTRSADEDVRRTVAGNPRVPMDVIEALASDPEPSVRGPAVGSKALSGRLLALLAQDDETGVRASVARNSRLDPALLRDLLLDEERIVRAAALRNPSLRPEDKAKAELERDRAWRASAPSRADLHDILVSKRAEDRIQPVYDARTPPDILHFLAGDRRSAKVRSVAAANPHTPKDVLASWLTTRTRRCAKLSHLTARLRPPCSSTSPGGASISRSSLR